MSGPAVGVSAAASDAAALIVASGSGDITRVRELIARAVDLRATDVQGRTALIAAAYGQHLDIARALVDAGADVNAKDNSVQSAYLIATSEIGEVAGLALLQLTLAHGADVRSLDSYNGTGLIRVAHRGHVEITRELLRTNIDVNHVNRLGWTALLEAIILGGGSTNHVEVVRLLVAAGADVNLADSSGVAPLAHARTRGYTGMVAILQAAGAREPVSGEEIGGAGTRFW